MNDERPTLADEAELHAFVDGRLAPAQRAAVEARLATDPELARRVHEWAGQRELLRGLHARVLDEPVPEHLLATARQLHRRSSRLARWQRWGGMAASLLVAFGVGWGGHGQWQARSAGAAPQRATAFAHQALVAHVVYVPEVRHPVEVDATQHDHLVKWLSKRLQRPLKVPNLGFAGYELVGGRLLPGDAGARAQFMYQNAAGERITLYVGAIDAAAAGGQGETAFRYTTEGAVASFYWVDQGFGYALSGKLPRPGLLALAEAVYKQL